MRSHSIRAASSLAIAATAMTGVAGSTAAEEQSFQDDFAGAKAALEWRPYPMFGNRSVEGQSIEQAPDGDGGIGVLRHEGGGLATVSYANTVRAEDSFHIEAYVFCPREAEGRDGSLTGIAFYLHTRKGAPAPEEDPEEGGFYRLVCDYRFGDAGFSLAYLGANIGRQPLELEHWPLIAQTARPEGTGDWHHLRVSVEQGLIELYLNEAKLNERPIPAERVITDIVNVDAGYAGVYAGHIGEAGAAEARIDDFTYRVP
jgi:hypothetical protein